MTTNMSFSLLFNNAVSIKIMEASITALMDMEHLVDCKLAVVIQRKPAPKQLKPSQISGKLQTQFSTK
jgi:hypothetical protein